MVQQVQEVSSSTGFNVLSWDACLTNKSDHWINIGGWLFYFLWPYCSSEWLLWGIHHKLFRWNNWFPCKQSPVNHIVQLLQHGLLWKLIGDDDCQVLSAKVKFNLSSFFFLLVIPFLFCLLPCHLMWPIYDCTSRWTLPVCYLTNLLCFPSACQLCLPSDILYLEELFLFYLDVLKWNEIILVL